MYIQLKIFLPSRRKSLLQHTVDNEVSALARLSFYENLFIGKEQVSVVCIKQVSVFIENG